MVVSMKGVQYSLYEADLWYFGRPWWAFWRTYTEYIARVAAAQRNQGLKSLDLNK